VLPFYKPVAQQPLASSVAWDSPSQEEPTWESNDLEFPTTISRLHERESTLVVSEPLSIATPVVVRCASHGFLQALGVAFLAMCACAPALAIPDIVEGNWLGILPEALLATAALLAAAAAFLHETLAKQVKELGRQNARYAAKNDRLSLSIRALGGVQDKLQRIQECMGITLQELQKTLRTLHRCAAIKSLTCMLEGFISADRYGNVDQRLTDREIDEFFGVAKPLLVQAAPEFDFDELMREAKAKSIDFAGVRLMTDAVVAGFEATPYKSSAIFSLVLFGLNPAEYQEDCKDHLLVTLRGLYTEDEIKNILEDRCAPYREQGFVPLKTLLDVSTAVRLHEPLAGSNSYSVRAQVVE